MYGRIDERNLLLQVYERSTRSNKVSENINAADDVTAAIIPSQELVVIHGRSGTGKTTLANSLVDRVVDKDGGYFLSGKFEQSSFHNPYEVFVSAFGTLSELLKASKGTTTSTTTTTTTTTTTQHNGMHSKDDQLRQAIQDAVGSEGNVITDMIPGFENMIDGPSADETYCAKGAEALHRFQFVFSKFVRAISSVAPLVLFFDDLQWSDPASLSLLQALLESQPEEPNHHQPSSNLLLICAFREDEIPTITTSSTYSEATDTSNLFTAFIDGNAASTAIKQTKIKLVDFDEGSTRSFLDECLHNNVSPELVDTLATIVFAKSGGNPFQVMQLVNSIKSNNAITMHNDGDRNIPNVLWDDKHPFLDQAGAASFATTTTSDKLLRQRLALLSPLEQEVMTVAACMGDCIDHQALCTFFQGNVAMVEDSLQIALTVGILAFDQRLGQFRFAHDKVREVVLSTVDDVHVLSFRIGHQLWTRSTPMFINAKMFVVTNLLNHGGTNLMKDQVERYQAAALNLEAGLKAMSLAAFPDACIFLEAGIKFLAGGDYWNDEYQLSLNLFTAAADAELGNHGYDRVVELANEVLTRRTSVKDRLPTYVTLMNAMAQRGNIEAAIKVGMDVLNELGDPLPTKVTKVSLIVEIVKARLALRGLAETRHLAQHPLQGEEKIAAIYLLTNLLTYTFQAASSNYCPFIGARIVRLSLKYGMHKYCAHGYAVLGFIVCTMDRKEGIRLGTLALTLVERYRAKEVMPRVHVVFYGFIHHWQRPLKDSWKPLANVINVGLEVGDVENATFACNFHAAHQFYGGTPLRQVEDMILQGNRRLRLSRQENMLETVRPFHQYIHNLSGRAPVAKILAGDVSPPFDPSRSKVDSLMVPFSHYFFGADLAFTFGDLDLAEEMLERKRQLAFQAAGLYVFAVDCFKEALIRVACARRRRRRGSNNNRNRRSNMRLAQTCFKQLKVWAKDCPENFLHKQQLVDAELRSLVIGTKLSKGACQKIQQLYNHAIAGAMKEGFVQEAALANELAGNFMATSCCHGDSADESARTYWHAAYALYMDWGATEKAKYLMEECCL